MKTLIPQSTDWLRIMQGTRMRVLITVINLLLVVWIAWVVAMAASSAGFWSSGREPLETAPPASKMGTLPMDQYAQLVRQLPSWHLFGAAARDAAPARPVAPVDAPDTHLKLVLHGAFSSGDEAFSRAIIADPRGKEEMYAIGDKLPGNAELREIHADRVILLRGGRYETLRLPQDEKSSGGTRASRRPSPAATASPAQRLGSLRQTLKDNPKSLYGLVRTTPKTSAEGNMIGYTLQPGRDPQLFEQMGLQPGDVVTRINDIGLDNLSNGMRALKSAQSGETVSMTVMRGDQEETLSFNVPE
jgi:general secretion pathway protein C